MMIETMIYIVWFFFMAFFVMHLGSNLMFTVFFIYVEFVSEYLSLSFWGQLALFVCYLPIHIYVTLYVLYNIVSPLFFYLFTDQ